MPTPCSTPGISADFAVMNRSRVGRSDALPDDVPWQAPSETRPEKAVREVPPFRLGMRFGGELQRPDCWCRPAFATHAV